MQEYLHSQLINRYERSLQQNILNEKKITQPVTAHPLYWSSTAYNILSKQMQLGYSIKPDKDFDYFGGRPYEYEVKCFFMDMQEKGSHYVELDAIGLDCFMKNLDYILSMIMQSDRKKDKIPLNDNFYVSSKLYKFPRAGSDLYGQTELYAGIYNRLNNKVFTFHQDEIRCLMQLTEVILSNIDFLVKNRDGMKMLYSSYLAVCSENRNKQILSTKGIENRVASIENGNQLNLFLQIPILFHEVLERDIAYYNVFHQNNLPEIMNSIQRVSEAFEKSAIIEKPPVLTKKVDDQDEGFSENDDFIQNQNINEHEMNDKIEDDRAVDDNEGEKKTHSENAPMEAIDDIEAFLSKFCCKE